MGLQRAERSAKDFQEKVWPVIKDLPQFKDGKLNIVEGTADGAALDEQHCIDYQVIYPITGEVHGIMSRIQYDEDYQSFTLRCQRQDMDEECVEWSKLCRLRLTNDIRPKWTVQAYMTSQWPTRRISVGIIETDKLILKMACGGLPLKTLISHDEDGRWARAYIADWAKLGSDVTIKSQSYVTAIV